MLEIIQDSIVGERNQFGDCTVCSDDLYLAGAAALLMYAAADPSQRKEMLNRAEECRTALTEHCPSIAERI